MGPTLYAVALGLAFVHTGVSLTLCALVPVFYILPGRVDAFWKPGHAGIPSRNIADDSQGGRE